ncbi:hypothetical protein NQ317_005591 [Molorchus minor]|uniref:Uncharacterized protein n=1 Tax=Molorchus minor TaxID=1323400 RepID=A0ABQ9K674_9CUCU|nr:hypothetical protein NQ317_005591 [Molorchus minor]
MDSWQGRTDELRCKYLENESTTVISLPNMVDLALNSPEVGIVNFTVLHSLLHVVVHQLNLSDINVEFRGQDSERLQGYIKTAKPGPLLTLTEYVVGPDAVDQKAKDEKKKPKDEKGKKDETQKEKKEVPVVDSEDNKSTVVLVKSKGSVENPQFTVVVTKNHFDKLEGDIKKLDDRIKELAELPANSALIQAIRTEDTFKNPCIGHLPDSKFDEKAGRRRRPMGGGGMMGGEGEEGGDIGDIPTRLERLEMAVFGGGDGKMPPQQAVQMIQQELLTMKANVDAFMDAMKEFDKIREMLSTDDDANLPPDARLHQLEVKFQDCMDQLSSLDNAYSRQINTLTKRLGDLEKQFGEIMEKVNLG